MAESQAHLWQRRWFTDLLVLVVLAVLIAMAVAASAVLLPVVIGLGLAYVFNPLLVWLERKLRLPRVLGALLILFLVVVVGLGVFLFVLPHVVSQALLLLDNLQRYCAWLANEWGLDWSQLRGWARQAATDLMGAVSAGAGEPAATTQAATTVPATMPTGWTGQVSWAAVLKVIAGGAGITLGLIGGTLALVSYLVLALVVIVYSFAAFAWRMARIGPWIAGFIPESKRRRGMEVLGMMDRAVSAFVRGRLLQALVMGVVLSLGWMPWVPYWLLLGLFAGMLNLVPYAAAVGCLLAVGLTVLDTLAGGTGAFSWWLVAGPVLVYLGAQLLDGWVIEPVVQGKATGLDSLTVMVAVLVGGTLGGLLGLLIAIPTASCLKILAKEVVLPWLYAEE
ncbi:MAG: AI-2E family transporter [Phycisphaeraceae bacterium]|nr:AI-2E family transporter [Phycisphaeraceae bacterium]